VRWALIEPQQWHDRVTGKTWVVIHTAYGHAGHGAMAGLSPGDYRVTVWANLEPRFRAPQRPMIGLGQAIHLDGNQARSVQVVQLETGPSLAVRLVDAATGIDVDHGRRRLIRPDSLRFVLAGPVACLVARWAFHLPPLEWLDLNRKMLRDKEVKKHH
jgi:hypothetical protein